MKKIVISVFVLLFAISGQAQIEEASGPLRERIESMKVAFITERLGLSPEQSKEFWPVYGQYEDSKKAIRQKYRASKTINQMSDKELEAQLLNTFKRDEEVLALNRSYFQNFKKVISVRQIALLKKAEQDFNREVLKKMMNWQQQKRKRRMEGNN